MQASVGRLKQKPYRSFLQVYAVLFTLKM